MLRIILAAVVLLVASCATIDTRSPEEIVGERALAQSEALVAQDFDTALSYTVPSYRQGPRAAFYQANHSGSGYWTRTEVRWVQCEDGPEAERCSVRIWTYGSPPFSGRFVSNRGDSAPSPVLPATTAPGASHGLWRIVQSLSLWRAPVLRRHHLRR